MWDGISLHSNGIAKRLMSDEGRASKGAVYHIRVQGQLDARWADYFDGFIIASGECGETLLSGEVVDQAALHGVLGKIRDLGLPLLLVAQKNYVCIKEKEEK